MKKYNGMMTYRGKDIKKRSFHMVVIDRKKVVANHSSLTKSKLRLTAGASKATGTGILTNEF